MSPDDILTTSPLLFGYRGRDGRLAAMDARGGPRFRLSSTRAAEVAVAFLDSSTIADARERHGFTDDDLEQALAAGILVAAESPAGATWERCGWSRGAYLLFSQMDLPFRESDELMGDRAAITAQRRAVVAEYLQDGDYPAPRPFAEGERLALPAPEPASATLAALTERRSARAFARRPPTARHLSDVLWSAIDALRLVARDRESDDAFRLLDSLYSWAHPFVVVQDVDDVPEGVYEYDWRAHALISADRPVPTDSVLLACVQGQRWVLGPGFIVFIVADLRGYAWLYRHSRAYIHALIQLGELGQEFLMAATVRGLAGWTTPAIAESAACAMLGLPDDDGVDVLSMIKLGLPRV